MIHIQRFFPGFFLLVLTETCLAAPAGVNWQWVNPKPQGHPFNAVAYNAVIGASVAVGDLDDVVYSSDDSIIWTVAKESTTQNINDIYTDSSMSFIAVGDNGATAIPRIQIREISAQ